jgi:hypothetical protein
VKCFVVISDKKNDLDSSTILSCLKCFFKKRTEGVYVNCNEPVSKLSEAIVHVTVNW